MLPQSRRSDFCSTIWHLQAVHRCLCDELQPDSATHAYKSDMRPIPLGQRLPLVVSSQGSHATEWNPKRARPSAMCPFGLRFQPQLPQQSLTTGAQNVELQSVACCCWQNVNAWANGQTNVIALRSKHVASAIKLPEMQLFPPRPPNAFHGAERNRLRSVSFHRALGLDVEILLITCIRQEFFLKFSFGTSIVVWA